MRAVFGILSLLVVVAIVGMLAKKQLGAAAPAAATLPAQEGAVAQPVGTPAQQVQQVRQAVDATMQQARPMPEEK
jgi:Na+-transporting methylmalonyl-CoA/oxaloacetate decarboxylase gamma subunit